MRRSRPIVRSLDWTAAAVVAWRLLAVVWPHDLDTDPPLVRHTLAVMGLWFLVCGLWVVRRNTAPAATLFAGYGLTGALHWGGPVGFGPPEIQNLLLAVYVVGSTALGQALFLHLALAYPPAYPAADHRIRRCWIYLPTTFGIALMAWLLVQPTNATALRLVSLLFPVGVLYSLIGGGIWIGRLIRADSGARRRQGLVPVVAAMVGGWLPHAIAASGPGITDGYDGLFNLPMIAIPTALAWSLTRERAPADVLPPRG